MGLFALYGVFKKISKPIFFIIFVPSYIFIFISLFFLQDPGLFDVFNFFAVSLLFFSLLSAYVLSTLLRSARYGRRIAKKAFLYGLVLFIVLFTLPRPIKDAYNFIDLYRSNRGMFISWEEIHFFQKAGKLIPETEVVLLNPTGIDYQTPFVASLFDKPVFLDGIGVLNAHGIDTKERHDLVQNLFKESDPIILKKTMNDNYINYILVLRREEKDFSSEYFKILLESEKYRLLKVI